MLLQLSDRLKFFIVCLSWSIYILIFSMFGKSYISVGSLVCLPMVLTSWIWQTRYVALISLAIAMLCTTGVLNYVGQGSGFLVLGPAGGITGLCTMGIICYGVGRVRVRCLLMTHLARKLEHQAHYDTLTDLPNRLFFIDTLDRNIKIYSSMSSTSTFFLLYMDIDGFKFVNDSYGHLLGDAVLVEASRRIRQELGDGDLLCRLGGDEFVAIVRSCIDIESARGIALRLVDVFNRPFLKHKKIGVGLSVGISAYPKHGYDSKTLLGNGDNAMYMAKRLGKNNVQVYRYSKYINSL